MKNIFTLLALMTFTGATIVVPQAIAAPAPKSASTGQYPNKGKVLEVIDTSLYTYIQVTGDKSPLWIAASKSSVKKGDNISYPSGAMMTNFYSKSLNRTFDAILFIDKVALEK